MAKDIWVISDTHFFHENILKFTDSDGELIRGALFDSVEEMNEVMAQRWNSVVKPGDYVYHLGDVFMGDKVEFKKYWKRLNGSKRLIVGNHDDIKWIAQNELFTKISMWRQFTEFGLLLSHVPLDPSGLMNYRYKAEDPTDNPMLLNVHGHIHQNPSPTTDHRCVCVEHINYTPIHIEELRIK